MEVIILFSIKAYNDEGWLASRPEEIVYSPSESKDLIIDFEPQAKTKAVPDFYGIVIGTSDYAGDNSSLKDLEYPDKDAVDIARALDFSARNLFIDDSDVGKNKIHIRLFNTDDQLRTLPDAPGVRIGGTPSKDNIKKAFTELSEIDQEDVLVIYLSGHGANYKKEGEQDGQFYYLTRDMTGFNLQDKTLREQYAISTEELIDWLNNIPAQKKVLIMDACASGKAVDRWDELLAQKEVPSSQKRVLEMMKDRTGLFMISGSTSDAVSYEASPYGQGLLTYSLLLGMSGPALQNSEYLDVLPWFTYAANKVPELASQFDVIQQPQVASPYKATSFPVGKVNNEDKAKIKLSQPKPYFLRCAFQNEETFADELDLSEKLNSELREITAKGKDAQVIYLDLAQHPNAYQIRGRYTLNNDQLEIKCKVFRGKIAQGEIMEILGTQKDMDNLVFKIMEEAISRLGKERD